ncbi:MAG: hypothetical protein LBR16_01830 [Treponema sp.]|jgi:hypothetical protein|nr:hypothetical protein [Treponema sp.]
MIKKRLLCAALLAAALCGPVFAGNVSLYLRFYDKRMYFLDSGPILVQVTISNNGMDTYRFKLADDKIFSLDINARTAANRPVPQADSLIRKRVTGGNIYFREVAIEGGESFSFNEDLRNYAEFKTPGSYIVSAALYPDLYSTAKKPAAALRQEAAVKGPAALESNVLSLVIRPPKLPDAEGGIEQTLDEETAEILIRAKLPPDEVVSYTITARQRSQWPKFFLYLDLEALLSRDPVRQRQWRAESEEGRARMLARFREELQKPRIDNDIAAAPNEFKILRTEYNDTEGTVAVEERFHYSNYTEVKEYLYILARKDTVWTIVDYQVTGRRTE